MPNHDFHELLSKLVLGKTSRRTNHIIDYPAGNPILHYDNEGRLVYSPLGPDHRKFGHDPLSALLIGLISGEGVDVAALHVAADLAFDGLHKIADTNVKQQQKPQASPQLQALNALVDLIFPRDQHINSKKGKKR